MIDVHRSDRGTYFTGLQTCGHVTCPVCGPTMREAARARLSAVVDAHLDAGGAVYLFAFTLGHGPADRLGDLLDALDAGRAAAIGSKGGSRWAKDRRDFGIDGMAWHREELHGLNGWHPHVHGVLFTAGELGDDDLAGLQSRTFGRFRRAIEKRGRRAYQAFNGIQPVRSPEALARYLTKQDRTAGTVAAEMTRGDLKHGEGLTPGAILHRFTLTGDAADLELYREYEQAMTGRRWRYLSPALTKRYAVPLDDDEHPADEGADPDAGDAQDRADAQAAVGGTRVMQIAPATWRGIVGTLGAVSALRHLVHVGDLDGALALVDDARRRVERRPPDRARARPPSGCPRLHPRAGP